MVQCLVLHCSFDCPFEMENTSQKVRNQELYNAAANGSLDEVIKLLRQGADPNYQPFYGKWTPLHAACANNHPMVVKTLVKNKASVFARDRIDYTPLHVACMYGYMDCVREFDQFKVVDASTVESKSTPSPSPLGLALEREQLAVVKHLITSVKISPSGLKDEVLELGCKKGDLAFVKLMMNRFSCDPEKQKQVILGLGCQAGDLSLIKTLINKYECDPKDPLNIFGDTPMKFAVQHGKLEVVIYLAKEHSLDPEDCLVIACKADHQSVVKYMLEEHGCNPNVQDNGETPLSHAKSTRVIQLLLKYGAVAEDAYNLYRKSLGKVLTKDPLVNPVKMFVVGFEREGKSTLIQSMQQERKRDAFSSLFSSKEITERTPGIVPKVFKSRIFGDVQFFDFAGQEIYYNSHAAFIKSSIVSCPPVFVLVIGLHRSREETEKYILKWMVILKNQCAQIHGKAPLIVVGSHLDEFKGDLKEREKFILSRVDQFKEFFYSREFLAMDCRKFTSPGIKELREVVGRRCERIREQLSVSLNSHMFLLFLLEHYSDQVFVSLKEACQKVECDHKSKKGDQIVPFIPTSYPHLLPICKQLSDNGHILFVHNSSSPGDSYIILNKATLLSEINGTIFAPGEFKQHKGIATSAGIVPKSKLAKALPDYDVDMLAQFMISLELAIPITDEVVLSLFNKSESTDEQYFFCPALISSKPPQNIWDQDDSFKYHFGWVLSCTESGQHFDNRFVEVLLLRLSSSLQPAKHQGSSVSRNCSFWKMGICWASSVGATILVEVDSDYQSISMRMRALSLDVGCLQLRTNIMKKIQATAKDLCNSVITSECFVPSKQVISYERGAQISDGPYYDIGAIAESVVQLHSSVSSVHNIVSIADLVGTEVYANLGLNILRAFFNNNSITAAVSDRFLRAFSYMLLEFPQQMQVIFSAISNKKISHPQSPPLDRLYSAMQSWSKRSVQTYKDLKDILDHLSVFGGRNPLELAGVVCEPFSEDELPEVDDSMIIEPPLSPGYYYSVPRGSLPAQHVTERLGSLPPRTSLPTNSLELTSSFSSHHSYQSVSSEFSVFSDPDQSLIVGSANPSSSLGRENRASRVLTLEELCERYGVSDTQLDQQIDLKNIQLLAGCFDDFETYMDALGLAHHQQTDIRDFQFRRGTKIAMAEALKYWYEPNPSNATYRALLKILLKLKKASVAAEVCKFLATSLPHTEVDSTESIPLSQPHVPEEAKDHNSGGFSLEEAKRITSEARSKWLLIGIELDIDMKTLKDIRRKYNQDVDRCQADMLSHWLEHSSSPTEAKLTEALSSPTIGREDLAPKVESDTVESDSLACEVTVSMKQATRATWDARAEWKLIGSELRIKQGDLDAIEKTYRDVDDCMTEVLYEWLTHSTRPSWSELVGALRAPSVNSEDIAENVEAKWMKKN